MKQPKIYLVASYSIRPRRPALTFQKDYIKQDQNIQYSESVAIARKIRDSDLTGAQVILDITSEKIIKCSYQGLERSYQALMEYYQRHYPSYVDPVLEQLGRVREPAPEAQAQSDATPSP
jgi:hypothetical protein